MMVDMRTVQVRVSHGEKVVITIALRDKRRAYALRGIKDLTFWNMDGEVWMRKVKQR